MKLFTFWDHPEKRTPKHIEFATKTHHLLKNEFNLIELNFNNINQYLPNFQTYWNLIKPRTLGQSYNFETRKIAIFTDLIRVKLLIKYGGFWVDKDTFLLKAFRNLKSNFNNFEVILVEDNVGNINNSIIGSKKDSNFLKAVDFYINEFLKKPSFSYQELGARAIEKALLMHQNSQIQILPSEYFHYDNQSLFYIDKNSHFIFNPLQLAFNLNQNAVLNKLQKSYDDLDNEIKTFFIFKVYKFIFSIRYRLLDFIFNFLIFRPNFYRYLNKKKQALHKCNMKYKKNIHITNLIHKLKLSHQKISSLKKN